MAAAALVVMLVFSIGNRKPASEWASPSLKFVFWVALIIVIWWAI